jgi:hypothetical protein
MEISLLTTATRLFWQGYKAISRPPFSKSDYDSILLLPAYKQRLKREVPVVRSVQPLRIHAQDCFDHMDYGVCDVI